MKDGGLGKFLHRREPTALDRQTVTRINRDTLYSGAVFDLDAGPVTITLPDAGRRFMSMQTVDEDAYTDKVVYGPGRTTLTKDEIGTRYVLAAVRIFVDAGDPKDVAAVNALQDAIKVEQPGGPGSFHVANWDASTQVDVRTALIVLAETLPDAKGMFGPRGGVDPVRRLIGSGAAWGGIPEKEALYLNVTPARQRRQDGPQAHRQGRSGRRLLVDQRLRRRRPLRAQPAEGLYGQQRHGEDRTRRLRRRPVRRLRRQDRQLPADPARLELHGPPLPAPSRDSERRVDIPGRPQAVP